MSKKSILGVFSREVGSSVVVLGENGEGVSSVGSLEGLIGGVDEGDSIEGKSGFLESTELRGIFRSEESSKNLVGLLLLLEMGSVVENSTWRTGLLLDPVDDIGLDSSSVVVNWGTLDEELQSWITLDSVFLGEVSVLSGVDLSNRDRVLKGLEILGGLGVFWGEFLTVSAPRSIELDEDEVELFNGLLEVVFLEDEHIVFLWEAEVNSQGGTGDESQ